MGPIHGSGGEGVVRTGEVRGGEQGAMRKRDRYAGLRSLVRGERTEAEVREEFEHHLASRVADYVAQGMTPATAREEALRRLGDVERYMAETERIDERVTRERRRRLRMDGMRRETRQALRSLRRSPLFAAVSIATLALGLGATGAIWTLLDSVVLRPLPYAAANELVFIGSRVSGSGTDGLWGVSPAGYFHYREQERTLDGLGVWYTSSGTVSGDGEAERVGTARVNVELLQLMGARPVAGRLFTESDEAPGSGRVVVLSHGLWQRRYGGDPSVIGRVIELDAATAEVIGVLERGIDLPRAAVDLYKPLQLDPAGPFRNEHYLQAIARLGEGETIASAQQDLAALTARFPDVHPQVYAPSFMADYNFAAELIPLRDHVLGGMARTMWVLFAAVGLVLLIAAANVANLFLLRAEVRHRDTAVRTALGAERAHLAFHSITESLLVALAAAGLALLLVQGAIQSLLRLVPEGMPRIDEVALRWSTVTVLAGLAVAIGIVFGMIPLARLSRDATSVLRESGRGLSTSRRQTAIRTVLVTAQFALALTLLASAGLLTRSFMQLRSVDPGLEPDGRVAMSIALPFSRYPDWPVVNTFHQELIRQLEQTAGITNAAITTTLPIGDGGSCSLVFIEGRPTPPGEQPPCLGNVLVSPGYFETMGITVEGRPPTWADNDARAGNVVISRRLADRFWPGGSALGRGIRSNGDQPPYYRITAVTADVRTRGLDEPPGEVVYYPLLPMEGAPLWIPPRAVTLIVRTQRPQPLSVLPDVRRVLAGLDPDVPIANIRTMDQVVAQSTARSSFAMTLVATAGLMALVLSAVGIYGVIAYLVGQRRTEIGIRMALGAESGRVLRMVVLQSFRLAAVGLLVGLILTLIATRALASMLFEVSPNDPLAIIGAILLLTGVAGVASIGPALKAAKVEPVTSLRNE